MNKLLNKICLTVLTAAVTLSTFAFAACGHTHTPGKAVRENEVAATCTQTGSYDEVVYCTDCKEEISRTTKTSEKAAHTPAAAIRENEVAATVDKAGSYDEVIKCSVCNAEISRTKKTIDKLVNTDLGTVYTFEAEYTKLAGLKGKGYSNEASGTGLIVHDGNGDIGEEGPAKASNGFFISYFYVKGLTLTFNITSDKAVENAVLSMRLSGELLETIELTCDDFVVKVNDEKMNYEKVVITDIDTDMSVETKREFQDFLVSSTVKLNEGNNVVTLTVNNSRKMVGAIGCTAPLIDCIKIQTTATLSWDPILKNLSRFEE